MAIEKEKNITILFSMDDECCDIKCCEEASIRAHISSEFIHGTEGWR